MAADPIIEIIHFRLKDKTDVLPKERNLLDDIEAFRSVTALLRERSEFLIGAFIAITPSRAWSGSLIPVSTANFRRNRSDGRAVESTATKSCSHSATNARHASHVAT